MRIVLDTNVLVSGLLSPFGPPAEVVRQVAAARLRLCWDVRILCEYREVLVRPAFGFDRNDVMILLDHIEREGELVTPEPLPVPLPDSDDEPFLAVARTGGVDALVTGNLRHFPEELRHGVVVLSPAELVEVMRGLHG